MDELKQRIAEVAADVKEIKHGQVELIKQGAVHNHVLTEHERRSTNLETRIVPLERMYLGVLGIGALAGLVAVGLQILHSLH